MTPPLGSETGVPAFSAYNQFSTPGDKPGWIRIVVSRAGWHGKDKPGNVTIKVGRARPRRRQAARARQGAPGPALEGARGKTRVFYVPADPPTRVEVTVSPTFSPHEFGGSDRRQLGAQVSYSFTEKRPK